MKALVLKSLNKIPTVINVPTPKPIIDEVLVKVAYCGVNRVDLGLLSGRFGHSVIFPHIMGSEVAGTLSNGRKVAVNPYLHCNKCLYCQKKEYLLCKNGRPLLGVQTNGGYAEFVVVPKDNLVSIPEEMPLDQAASVILSASTAYRMINTKAKLKTNDIAIITAAGSGVGIYACQIAKLHDVFVIGLTGKSDKEKKLKVFKVNETINYSDCNWVNNLKNLLDRKEANILIDTVGGQIMEKIIPLLSPSAKIVTCGATENPRTQIDLIDFYMKQKTLI